MGYEPLVNPEGKRFVCSDDRIATMKKVALREEDYLGLALLARLEAAEWLAGMAEGPQDAIDAWRKAVGK